MSVVKRAQKITTNQLDLYQQADDDEFAPENAPDLDINQQMLGAYDTAIKLAKRLGLSRARIVERINLCLPELERPLTLRQLNSWTAASQEYKEMPARYLPAFCWATTCDMPLHVMANSMALTCANADDQAALELGRLELSAAAITAQRRILKQQRGR